MVVEDGFFHADFIRQNFTETTTGGCLFENLKNLMLRLTKHMSANMGGKFCRCFGCHPVSLQRQWRFLEGGFQAAQGTTIDGQQVIEISRKKFGSN